MRTPALRRLAVLLATPALVAFACRGPERRGADAGAGAASGSGPAVAREPEPTFERFEAGGVPAYALMRERGRGVVHLDPGPLLAGRVADTLVARAEPKRDARALARLILDTTGVFTFEARPGVLARPGALEFGYEEIGLPILERGTGGWERVYLGEGADGQPVSGWARAQPTLVGVTIWDELLPGQPLFFALPPDSVHFHAAPDGAEERFAIEPEQYILWPLEQRGDWMRVRAVSPSDYCAEPGAARQDTLWIRWRAETGRPRVWFYTRGC